jgi:hypothetical protein
MAAEGTIKWFDMSLGSIESIETTSDTPLIFNQLSLEYIQEGKSEPSFAPTHALLSRVMEAVESRGVQNA